MCELPIGTVTFLFTDIEGSTRILRDLGEKYSECLSVHAQIIRESLTRYDGIEIRIDGDSFFCVFQDAVCAVNAVIAIQRNLAYYDWPPKGQIRVRMGLHTGQGTTGEGNYVGIDVHRAARIAAAGHGGQVLLSAETYTLTKRSFPADIGIQDLGEHGLKDLPELEHLYQLVIPELPVEFPVLRSLAGALNNIPEQLTNFFGRSAEKCLVRQKMESARLVTLVGPGGTGKTRLALEVADAETSNFEGGVWLTELATIADPALVPQTIAASLGLREQPGIALPVSIANHISQQSYLLILDNCEHLLNAVSSLTDGLLKECPNLKVLVTTRQSLGVPGEAICQIPGLSVPSFESSTSLDELANHESVMLFNDRATLRKPDFKITSSNAPYLTQICRRLDGMPLAIELAASRVNVLDLQQITERLDDRFQLLTKDVSGALSQNQTLRLTMDWSYDLLSEQEATLFRSLSVFSGGFSLDAVEMVCGQDQIASTEILDLLQQLIEKSLVYLDSNDQAAGYQLLETVREYAKDKLSMGGESAILKQRHAEYFLMIAKESERETQGAGHTEAQAAALNRLEANHDNLRTALDYLTGENAGVDLAGALWRFWEIRGYLSEGRESLKRAMSGGSDLPSDLRARALDGAGRLAWRQGDFKQVGPYFQESLELWRSAGNREGEANALHGLARAAINVGDNPAAQKWAEQSLDIQKDLENESGIALGFNTLGEIARSQGDFKRAESHYTQSLELFRAIGDTAATVTSLHNLAYSSLNQGNTSRAEELFHEALIVARNLNDQLGIFSMLGGLAATSMEQGDLERAAELFGAAEVVGRTGGYAGDRIDQTEIAQRIKIVKQKLDVVSFDRAWDRGQNQSSERAIKIALGE